ncbi:MAG: PAS domain S-box protein [Armatimonadetes bacterium]|nr:PAS domain S-box protein [Armatimonadota bacterium]
MKTLLKFLGFGLIFILLISCIQQKERNNERIDTLLNSLDQACYSGIVLNTLDGKTLDANQVYLDMLGYSIAEIREITFQELTPKEWHEMEQELFEKVLKEGYSGVYEKEYIRKDGTIFPTRHQAWLIYDDEGKPSRLFGIVQDITPKPEDEIIGSWLRAVEAEDITFNAQVVFNEDKTFDFIVLDEGTNHTNTSGENLFKGNQITFIDADCPEPGIYQFEIKEDILIITVLSDSCKPRTVAWDGAWTRKSE